MTDASDPAGGAPRPATHHAELGEAFFDVVEPARFPAHLLRHRDERWAARVGLQGLTDAEWIAHFGRFEPLPGSFPRPLALRYHGHQFRTYNPDLGDGRGFLFAQLRDLRDGRLLDLGTKGSGPHAVVARRRRAADAEGRRARGAGHRNAGGAGRRHLQVASA